MKPTKIIKVWDLESGFVKLYKLMSNDNLIKEISREEVSSYNVPVMNWYTR
jgi:hypothetical protein